MAQSDTIAAPPRSFHLRGLLGVVAVAAGLSLVGRHDGHFAAALAIWLAVLGGFAWRRPEQRGDIVLGTAYGFIGGWLLLVLLALIGQVHPKGRGLAIGTGLSLLLPVLLVSAHNVIAGAFLGVVWLSVFAACLWSGTDRSGLARLGFFLVPALLIAFVLVSLRVPIYHRSQGSPNHRGVCQSNLRNVGTALLNYAQRHGGDLPPAYVADKNGKPMHSWRALILPMLDRPDLFAAYDFNEPWDGPNNRKLHSVILEILRCSYLPPPGKMSEPNFVVVTGPGTLFPGDKPTNLNSVTDDLSTTILLVEVRDSGVHWMEPRDLPLAEALKGINVSPKGISSNHLHGVNVVFADGSLRFISDQISLQTLKALLTANGGEVVKDADLQR